MESKKRIGAFLLFFLFCLPGTPLVAAAAKEEAVFVPSARKRGRQFETDTGTDCFGGSGFSGGNRYGCSFGSAQKKMRNLKKF